MGREYPSVRKALLGQSENGVANLWCGVKWLLWQLTYVAIAVFFGAVGLLLLPFFLIGKFVSGGRTERFGKWLGDKLYYVATHDYVSKAVRYTLVAVTLGSIASLAGALVYGLTYYPQDTLIMVGLITVVILAAVTGIFIAQVLEFGFRLLSDQFSSVKDRSKEKPVARRLVGYCPVSMDITPRWFEKLFEP